MQIRVNGVSLFQNLLCEQTERALATIAAFLR